MNRRSLIQLLIGVIAAVVGLTTMVLVRQDRCLDAGGSWSAQTRVCLGPDGPLSR
jgi:preprotein translocase subunit SecG